jgi:hypothetical protein
MERLGGRRLRRPARVDLRLSAWTLAMVLTSDGARPRALSRIRGVEWQILARRIGVAARPAGADAVSRCSSACSRDAVDRQCDARRGETPRRIEQRTRWTTWTRRVCVDGDRLTHNPEVAGSNPAPATSFRRSRPFPSRERAFCVSGTVVKRVAATALRAARLRDGGDGVTRDETAETWWTLPPAISGCLARR